MDERLRTAIDAASVVSLDIFDTAILRVVEHPKDIFALVEREAMQSLGTCAEQFTTRRLIAERTAKELARKRNESDQVSLDRMYEVLLELFPYQADEIEWLKAKEIALEKHLARRNPAIYEAYRYALRLGKRVVFSSDMYLPMDVIAFLLDEAGYREREAIFLSNVLKTSKRVGGLYEHLLKALGVAPDQVLHIGDDELSDGTRTREAGLRSYVYLRGNTLLKRIGWDREFEALSCPVRSLHLGLLTARVAHQRPLMQSNLASEFWRLAGERFCGVLYLGFTSWLAQKLRENPAECVVFLSRDGWIMEKTYALWRKQDPSLPPGRYLYGSRRAFAVPALTDLEGEQLDLFVHDSERRPLEHFLQRVGLRAEDLGQELSRHGFHANCILNPRMDEDRLRALLKSQRERILAYAASQRSLVESYFRQEGLATARRIAFVDIGWQGSMQESLVGLLSRFGFKADVDGYYLGTFPEAKRYQERGRKLTGYLCDLGLPAEHRQGILRSVPFFEFLFSAPHGSVKGYRKAAQGVEPLFEENHIPAQREMAATMQQAALGYVEEFLTTTATMKLFEIPPTFAIAPLLRLLENPDILEARMVGDLKHIDSFEGVAEARYLARLPEWPERLNPKAMRRAYLQSHWRKGFVRRVTSFEEWLPWKKVGDRRLDEA